MKLDDDDDPLNNNEPQLDPVDLQSAANFIRQGSTGLQCTRLQQAVTHINFLQGLTDRLIMTSQRMCQQTFETGMLFNCLMLSGYLKYNNDLRDALRYACVSIIAEPA
eukprot:7887581-Lingulodinium_polyedra.AAC.1